MACLIILVPHMKIMKYIIAADVSTRSSAKTAYSFFWNITQTQNVRTWINKYDKIIYVYMYNIKTWVKAPHFYDAMRNWTVITKTSILLYMYFGKNYHDTSENALKRIFLTFRPVRKNLYAKWVELSFSHAVW